MKINHVIYVVFLFIGSLYREFQTWSILANSFSEWSKLIPVKYILLEIFNPDPQEEIIVAITLAWLFGHFVHTAIPKTSAHTSLGHIFWMKPCNESSVLPVWVFISALGKYLSQTHTHKTLCWSFWFWHLNYAKK